VYIRSYLFNLGETLALTSPKPNWQLMARLAASHIQLLERYF
jgi:hypothetical protein